MVATTPIGLFALLAAVSLPSSEGLFPTVPSVANVVKYPACHYEMKTASCCATFSVGKEMTVCNILEVIPNELKVTSTLMINGVKRMEQGLAVGKLCSYLLAFACLNVYWVDIDRQEKRFEACFQGSVAGMATVDFQCVQYDNGVFSRNTNHQPGYQGYVHMQV